MESAKLSLNDGFAVHINSALCLFREKKGMMHASEFSYKYLFYSIRESQKLIFSNWEKQTTTDLMHQIFYSMCTLPNSSSTTLLSKYSEDGGSELLRNFIKYLLIDTASYSRRLQPLSTPPSWETQIYHSSLQMLLKPFFSATNFKRLMLEMGAETHMVLH